MTRDRLLLWAIALGASCALLATLLVRQQTAGGPGEDDPPALAKWLGHHPADWLVAARLTEISLDSASPDRLATWRELHALGKRLAPHRTNADAAFVRAGLFHWYELGAGDRERVLMAAKPLLEDPEVFKWLYEPLWQLTRDLATLRRISPRSSMATASLKKTAVENGLFDHYRDLRQQERRLLLQRATEVAKQGKTAELMRLVPSPLRRDDHEMVQLALASYGRDASAAGSEPLPQPVAEYVLRHEVAAGVALRKMVGEPSYPPTLRARLALFAGRDDIATRIEVAEADPRSPVWIDYFLHRAELEARRRRAEAADTYLNKATGGGLTPSLLRTAATTAELLGRSASARAYRSDLRTLGSEPVEWRGTCGKDELCGMVSWEGYAEGESLPVRLSVVQSDEIPPYVEIYVDDRLVQETAVRSHAQLSIPLSGRGRHRIEILLVNPHTRTGVQRRLRVS
ncbi:MAG: hypothetical protein WA208_12895 [Thermoanaerobaculia bacterium]